MKTVKICNKCGSRNFRKVWVNHYNASEYKLTIWEWIQLVMFRRIEILVCNKCDI